MADALIRIDQLASLLSQVTRLLTEWKEPAPPFRFEIGWSSNYDNLLLEHFDLGVTSSEDILAKALQTGRVLMVGRAGAAKTTVVYRLVKELLRDPRVLPVILNLKSWKAPYYKDWSETQEDFTFRLSFLLERVSTPQINLAVLDSIDPTVLRVLIVDGLNEITPGVAQEIITVIDEYVRRATQSVAIITDRVVRRSFGDAERWQLCALKPLTDAEIHDQLRGDLTKLSAFEASPADQRQLFRTPLFLDMYLHSDRAGGGLLTTEAEMRYYFERQIGLTEAEIINAGRAAFEIYKSNRARTFPLADLSGRVDPEVTAKLTASSIKTEANGDAYFIHHLHHDYLAACYFASDPSLWTQEGFDALTFKAASFDSLALVLEQLKESERADLFIEALYDWNVYAPAYALAEASYGGPVAVTGDMQSVVYAMLSEKRWDFMLQTAERASDALSLFPGESLARRFLEFASLEDLVAFVAQLEFRSDKYIEWRRIFCLPSGQAVPIEVVKKITASDSIIGWTLANVLKRTSTTADLQSRLREWAKEYAGNSTVLWRIAHVLGAYPSEENFGLLLNLLDKHPVLWPRYGALRSLIEIAGKSPSPRLRLRVFESLAARVKKLPAELLGELRRALFIRNAPQGWLTAAYPLLNAIYLEQREEEDRKQWMRTFQQLERAYSG